MPTTDVLTRLSRWATLAEKSHHGAAAVDYVTLRDAADEIERLRAELAERTRQHKVQLENVW